MKKHEQPTNRFEKMSNLSRGSNFLKRNLYAVFAVLLGIPGVFAEDGMIWQLGTDDNSSREFRILYHAWEYGNAPQIQSSPAMDHKTHTFRYTVPENKAILSPDMINGLYTGVERYWMHDDEIVSNLELGWNDPEGGPRLLTVKCADWGNQCLERNGIQILPEGIQVLLPDGGKEIFNLPDGNSEERGPFSFEVVFKAVKGENRLTLCNASPAKHYNFHFDSIKLSRTDRKPEHPVLLNASVDAFSGILHPGEPAGLTVGTDNADGGNVAYIVRDAEGKTVAAGNIALAGNTGHVRLPSDRKGYFSVECRYRNAAAAASYVVVEPVTPEYLPGSRFGCHGLRGDSYRLRFWPEREEIRMRRASLAGCRWARMHGLSWADREPEKGKFDWRYLDERLGMAEKYKIIPTLGVGWQPDWASESTDRTLTMCGDYRLRHYPPKNYDDWANFLTMLVQRCGNRVKYYEIANEPGYNSAFWSCGSASAYGKYLETAYRAIKKARPDAVVYPGAPIQVDFLEDAVRSTGGKPEFDQLSIHYSNNYVRGGTKVVQWKRMLEKMGKKPEIVNSEDMSWSYYWKEGNLKESTNVVRVYVRDAAQGILRTFGFAMFDDGATDEYSFFDRYDRPRPQFAVYRAMTHQLEHSVYVGDLSSAGYEAYLFDREGTPVIVFWSDRPCRIDIPAGTESLKLVDAMDNEKIIRSSGGMVELNADYQPQYLVGGSLPVLKRFVEAGNILPKTMILEPGKLRTAMIGLPDGVAIEKISLPAGWTGSVANAKLEISAPANTASGIYDASFRLQLCGMSVPVAFVLEVVSPGGNVNLIHNGDFEKGSAYWFGPQDKSVWAAKPGIGTDGSGGLRVKGTVNFGPADSIKVRPGEQYLFFYDVRGEGGCCSFYSLLNEDRKTVYPNRPGLNAVEIKTGSDWRRGVAIINVTLSDARYLRIGFNSGSGEIDLDNVTVARITESNTVSKLLNHGIFRAPAGKVQIDGKSDEWRQVPAVRLDQAVKVAAYTDKTPWKGPADLSGTFRVMLDRENFYLLAEVRDDILLPGTSEVMDGWKNDSLQIAIDPLNDGRDYTEITIGRLPDGKPYAYKYKIYWTPELPEKITRRGVIPGAEIATCKTADGIIYEIRIPLAELYPLTGNTEAFGFNFLVNDDDGHGRKYIEWAGGTGGNKSPAEFGVLRRQ